MRYYLETTKIEKWWELIYKLVEDLDRYNIAYSFDASTSLFVHGIDAFEMEDLDIMIQWNHYKSSHEIFEKYKPTPISQKGGFWHFRFYIDDLEVHLMSSDQICHLQEDPEHVCIEKDGVEIWSKSIQFYRRYTTDTYLQKLIDDYLDKVN